MLFPKISPLKYHAITCKLMKRAANLKRTPWSDLEYALAGRDRDAEFVSNILRWIVASREE